MAKLCPFIARLPVAALGVFMALPSHAQPAWPTQPVKLVVLKATQGKCNDGSFGRGSSAHLAAEAWRAGTGTDIRHIPCKGVAEIIPALIGGDIQVLFASQAAALPHIKAGKLVADAGLKPE
ncbi:hypothetical protein GCM10023165_48560 [Variovorax defluvii]|uniref:ABC transporter substrate-binding protein n=1 Tax=Variovorax defluvii TaxID=913761 RepID=A0ABP8ICS0_9BURK